MSLNKLADEFNAQYGLVGKAISDGLSSMCFLIEDEIAELCAEVYIGGVTRPDPTLQNVVKEAIDTIYITMQQLRERGVDVDAALNEVHRSNLSKRIDIYEPDLARAELEIARKRYPAAELVPHGSYFVIKCAESGKVVKPTTYSPAAITDEMIGL